MKALAGWFAVAQVLRSASAAVAAAGATGQQAPQRQAAAPSAVQVTEVAVPGLPPLPDMSKLEQGLQESQTADKMMLPPLPALSDLQGQLQNIPMPQLPVLPAGVVSAMPPPPALIAANVAANATPLGGAAVADPSKTTQQMQALDANVQALLAQNDNLLAKYNMGQHTNLPPEPKVEGVSQGSPPSAPTAANPPASAEAKSPMPAARQQQASTQQRTRAPQGQQRPLSQQEQQALLQQWEQQQMQQRPQQQAQQQLQQQQMQQLIARQFQQSAEWSRLASELRSEFSAGGAAHSQLPAVESALRIEMEAKVEASAAQIAGVVKQAEARADDAINLSSGLSAQIQEIRTSLDDVVTWSRWCRIQLAEVQSKVAEGADREIQMDGVISSTLSHLRWDLDRQMEDVRYQVESGKAADEAERKEAAQQVSQLREFIEHRSQAIQDQFFREFANLTVMVERNTITATVAQAQATASEAKVASEPVSGGSSECALAERLPETLEACRQAALEEARRVLSDKCGELRGFCEQLRDAALEEARGIMAQKCVELRTFADKVRDAALEEVRLALAAAGGDRCGGSGVEAARALRMPAVAHSKVRP
mmetsp:Transcript_54930/g.158970  ORF Transcript_54930/g.158970 Transcript_54930/m.158970 type:complete len:596 (+) Transcript_54930:74-1861(+)